MRINKGESMNRRDRFSFSTGALYPFESDRALQMIRDAGFHRAELMPQALSDSTEESTKKFEKTGILLGSIHYPLVLFGLLYNCQKTMIEDSRRYAKELLTMGKRLDCRVLVVHPHDPPSLKGYYELLEKPVIDNIRYLADLCGDMGYTLAMENHPRSAPTARALNEYIDFLDHPVIRPMVDTTEAREADQDPVEFIRGVKTCHMHMSDFAGMKHLPAGEGEFDWQAIRRALDEQEYEGFYTLEPAYKFYLEDAERKLKKAYAFLEENFL